MKGSAASKTSPIVQISAGIVPEALIERMVSPCGKFCILDRFAITHRFPDPAFHQAKRVVPERIDFDCFSASRCDDPIADLRIHPGELISIFALPQQSVRRIDADTEEGAANMVFDDIDE